MHADPRFLLRPADVGRRFDQAANQFDAVDFVHGVTREGLLSRLEPMLIKAGTIVDLGSATGSAARSLTRRFRGGRIIAIDISLSMLQALRRKKSRFAPIYGLQADAGAIPLRDQTVDLVFANLLLPWIDEPSRVFHEVARVLRKDGLFVFATLGPDSLAELRRAWQAIDDDVHINHFPDMHDIGDATVHAGLRDPVLDTDRLTVTYKHSADLFADLTAAGARNCLQARHRGLTGKHRFEAMRKNLESGKRNGLITLDLEIVYGHCWGSGTVAGGSEYRVHTSKIKRRKLGSKHL